jgi:hypothetical protein
VIRWFARPSTKRGFRNLALLALILAVCLIGAALYTGIV